MGAGIDATKHSAPASPLSLPLSVAVIIDQSFTGTQTLQINITAFTGSAVSLGSSQASIANGQHQTLSVTLTPATVDRDLGMPDLAGSDAAMPDLGGADLSGPDLSEPTDDGGCTLLPISTTIANFENDSQAKVVRNGAYMVIIVDNAETGTTTPAKNTGVAPELLSPARGTSTHAAHITATNLTGYGANASLGLAASRQPVDLSRYSGIQFWAKGTVATIRPSIHTSANLPTCATCAGCGSCTNCYDAFGKFFTPTTTWAQYSATWSQLTQLGFGVPAATLNPGDAIELIFSMPNGSWEVWIDDVTLMP